MFVGFSPLHSLLVPLVLNIHTGKISPQYHVVFDDKFETVPSLPLGESLHQQWNNKLQFPRECYLDVDIDHNGFPNNPPSIYDWESPPRTLPLHSQGVSPGKSDSVPVEVPEEVSPGVPDGVPVGVPEGVHVGVLPGALVEAPVGDPLGAPEGVPMGAPFPTPKDEFVQGIIETIFRRVCQEIQGSVLCPRRSTEGRH